MALVDLASELVLQVFYSLTTILDVVNLSLTCRRFHGLLRRSQKLSILFEAGEREFGPVGDAVTLVTFNHTQPAHVKRAPALSYPLLRQIMVVGRTAKKVEQLYPSLRWHDDYLNRRSLTAEEGFRVRRAVYRYWLYCEAFHNRAHLRTNRLLPLAVQDRARLLRSWGGTEELLDIQDVMSHVFEHILDSEICPTDGQVYTRAAEESSHFLSAFSPSRASGSWPPSRMSHSPHPQVYPLGSFSPQPDQLRNLFYSSQDDQKLWNSNHTVELPVTQLRYMRMEGWGDSIMQYHHLQSLLKLNPAHVMRLYEHAVYKAQLELLVPDLSEEWFWNNGQTFSDTWRLVLESRGLDPEEFRIGVQEGTYGITAAAAVVVGVGKDCPDQERGR